MKKFITLVVFLSAIVLANAQVVQFGITADVAFDQYKNVFYIPKDAEIDRGWGLGAKLKITSPMGLGVDASLKIAQEDRDYFYFGDFASTGVLIDSNYDMNDRFTYLSIPVNLRFDLDLPLISHMIIPFVFAGPEMYYNFNQYNLKEVADSMKGLDTTKPITDYLHQNRTNWFVNFGFGVVLARRVEVAYQFRARKTQPFQSDFFESTTNPKTSKLALTLYF